ncbi:DUF927 domain-containing protein [Paraburkholderia sp. BL10I2N1]|uniref:DUF927 domain-containing protein n=1 Tax=Paraburkholderia sp. BL10I2N1 TaxID=1938796 RepID=UPI00105F9CF7|nr:DUF927 domain-containing protein [Paraburkholderia sp. BL10I2N1]TDN70486.1 uncharacterized protein DUF927 [Paraburkholderia sp. BL10I2N1]
MDTLEFFRAILPETGPYYLAYFKGETPYPYHVLYPTLEVLAEKALELDAPGTNAVYHACASYREAYVMLPDPKKPGELKKCWRVAENLGRMKSFWVDIDCGPEKAAAVPPKGYATKNDARDAIMAFCGARGLPYPLMVSSGNGLHCYWPLTKSIGPKSWQAVAQRLKAALAAHGILADPTRTADAASILRPPGTYNRKGEPKPVKVVYPGGQISPEDFLAALESVSTLTAFSEQSAPAYLATYLATAEVSSWALAGHAAYSGPPASARIVAEHCRQVRHMRDTLGDVGYEVWRGVIGIIKHCTEGETLAQEWSEERANTGHESLDWQRRYDTWDSGPTTCGFFLQHNPTGCDGCPHREKEGAPKVTSPIMLGFSLPPAETSPVVIEVDDAGGKLIVEVPPKPEGYVWEDERLYRYLKDKDGIVQRFSMSDKHFYLTHWIATEARDFSAGVRLHMPRGSLVDFAVTARDIAAPSDMLKALGSKSIFPTHNKDAAMHLHAYIKDSLQKIQAEAEEMSTMTSFGWRHDSSGFLVGDRLYHRDGTIRKVLVGGSAHTLLEAFPDPRGTLDGYCRAVNFVYARAGMEPLQYALCNAFGSILTPFSGEALYNGVLFALIGERTARGKTTVAMAGLYGFGDARLMTHTRESTVNARYALMGVHKNAPLLFDEFTDIPPDQLSSWAYSTSEGREKSRLQTGAHAGVKLAQGTTWALAPYVTANTNLHARLTQHRSNTAAEAVRIVQVDVDRYQLPQLEPAEVTQALARMERNMGHAGEQFVQYVVTHQEDVLELAGKIKASVDAEIQGPEYRYYRAHATCTLTAASIMVQLGLVDFDFDRLFDFTIGLMRELSFEVAENNTVPPEDLFSQMVNALAPRIITTYGYQDNRMHAPEEVRIYQEVVGRYVVGNAQTSKALHGRLWITVAAVKQWCIENRVPVATIKGFADPVVMPGTDDARVVLTRGTKMAGARAHCFAFDMKKMGVDSSALTLVHGGDAQDATN